MRTLAVVDMGWSQRDFEDSTPRLLLDAWKRHLELREARDKVEAWRHGQLCFLVAAPLKKENGDSFKLSEFMPPGTLLEPDNSEKIMGFFKAMADRSPDELN